VVLETDLRTGLSYPRLLGLTNGTSVARANKALEAIRGRVIRKALDWNRQAQLDSLGRVWDPDGVSTSATVKLTYFSAKYISALELGSVTTAGNSSLVLARSAMVNIERGSITTTQSCGSSDRLPLFRIGDLLRVCDERRLEIFQALWREEGHAIQAKIPKQGEEAEKCRYSSLAYVEDGFISLYLTHRGLAVHNAFAAGGEQVCFIDPDSRFVPVVIPWRKLQSMMEPGPLRDELLSGGG
jgi:hypothetical protein